LLRAVSKDHPQAGRLRVDARHALRQLKRIRSSAGPVRDLDVQRRLIAEIIAKAGASRSAEEQKMLGDDGERLDESLRRRRKKLAVKLTLVLGNAKPKLERELASISDAMTGLGETSLLKPARTMMLHSSLHLKDLSRESLHRYRKQTKAARYLAEMEGTSVAAQRLANRLKRVLDAIGRWHDLMLLAQEAKGVLGKQSMLVEAIREERERALRIAVRSAGTIRQMP
jgi:CHAD domain-containing protein